MRCAGSTLLLLMAACAGLRCSSGTCRVNGDCARGELCLDDHCQTAADSGLACATGHARCTSNADCPNESCISGCCALAACKSDSDCMNGDTCVGGLCTGQTAPHGCQTNTDCISSPSMPFCDTSTLTCVGCRTVDDCGDSRMECSDEHVCVWGLGYCGMTTDCSSLPTTPACDTATNTCVACVVAADCATGYVCSNDACVMGLACTSDQSCASLSATPYCGAGGSCVACTPTEGCTANQMCQAGACVSMSGCTQDADCAGQSGTPYCGSGGNCVACTATEGCAAGQICETGICIPSSTSSCTTSQDCASMPATPLCDAALGMCVQCVDYTACPLADVCDDHVCVPVTGGTCHSDNDCLRTPTTAYCETRTGSQSGVCVECLSAETADPCEVNNGICQNDVCVYGCSQLLSCLGDCGNSEACISACEAATSTGGLGIFRQLDECILQYCPATGGGICDETAQTYNASNCSVCIQGAQLEFSTDYFPGGGPCYYDNVLCNAD